MAARQNTADLDLEDSDLGAIVAQELAAATSFDESLMERRTLTLQYLRGEMPDLPGRKNGSQQTDRTVSDVLSWMHPGIMRSLTASDQMVRYAPVKDENQEWSEQATAYTNWSFWRNDGYRVVFHATHDGLSVGNGLVRCYYEEEQTKTEKWNGVTAEDIAEKLQDDSPEDIRILSKGAGEAKKVEGEDGVTTLVPTMNLKIERILSRGKICDEVLKPENLRVNSLATTLESARFIAYLHDEYTRSDLVEMGFPRDKVEALPAYQSVSNLATDARLRDTGGQWDRSAVRSGDVIETYECYVRADADGDGIAEMLQVWFAGSPGSGVVLAWDYWDDEIPFTDIPCYPVPHRWDAESVADRTMDIQRVKTALLRALLDSTYASVLPQRAVKQNAIINPDALVNPRFGSVLWVDKSVPMAEAIMDRPIAYTGDKALVALQHMDEQTTKRTGISRTTMALDPEALTNQTATATQAMRDAGYSQVELVARNMAELGWAKYFSKRLKLAIKHKIVAKVPMKPKAQPQMQPQMGQQPGMPQQPMMAEPEFKVINAAEWDENMAVSINTGLGTGSRDRDMAMLRVMMGTQVEMAQQLSATGLPTAKAKAIEFIPKIINSAVLLAESAGIKDPSEHYPEIGEADVAKMIQEAQQLAAQGDPKIKLEREKIKADVAGKQAGLQMDQQKMQADAQLAGAKMQADIQLQREQLQAELALKREQLNAELMLKREQLVAELQLKKELGVLQSATSAATSQVHPGGEPG